VSNVQSHNPSAQEPASHGGAPKHTPEKPDKPEKKTVYETSAGGVVLRHIRGVWQVAIIEPNIINADTVARRTKARPEGTVFALPKGGVDEGETPEQSAGREVYEETGVRGTLLFRLTTIRYLYQRSWGGREHVSKAVSFYLFLYHSGRLGQIHPEMHDEVRRAFWFPLDKAHRKLTYRGEREVLKMAQKMVREHPERLTPPPPEHVACGPAVERPVAQQRSASQRFNWTPRNDAPARTGGPSSQRSGPSQRSGSSAQRSNGQPQGASRGQRSGPPHPPRNQERNQPRNQNRNQSHNQPRNQPHKPAGGQDGRTVR
jgi:8-oxo-dGTP pyrophosphatase MutT (NUDIX family)